MRTRNQDNNKDNTSTKEKDKEVENDPAHASGSDRDDDNDGDENDDGPSEYERMRLENIRRNRELMEQLDIPQTVAAMSSSRGRPDRNKRSAPTSEGGPKKRVEKKVKTVENLPRRTSNRLANIEPDGAVAAKKLEDYRETVNSLQQIRSARRAGILSMSDVSNGRGDDTKFEKLLAEMATYVPDKARVKDAEDESDNDAEDSTVKKEKDGEDGDNNKIKHEPSDDKDVKKEQDTKGEDSKVGIKKYFKPATRGAAAAAAASTSNADTTKASLPSQSRSAALKFADKEPSLRKKVQALRIKGPWPTIKVCEGRVYCMAIHENKDKILVCGGDIDGNVGFWDLDESLDEDYEPDYNEQPNTYQYKVHTRTLSSMQYSPTDPTKLYTTSYDGSVRYFDLTKAKILESYVVKADASDHLGSISMDSTGQQLWFADNDGAVTLKDVRTPKDEMVYRKVLHEKKVGCVNVNPKYSNLIITSSLDRTMKIWDIRTFGQYKADEAIAEIAEFPHRLSVTSAMWSPDGMSIASTSYDDNVRIFNNFDPALPDIKEIPEPVRIHHNNQSGRWVTMLRAVWSHQFNWFSIGNMNKSVDIYSRGTGDLMANLRDAQVLTTVPAVNAWHPNRVLLASGMANGKMVIWR